MRAIIPLLLCAVPALAETIGTPVRNPCAATDGSGDVCYMASVLASEMTAESPRDLAIGVRLLGATQAGAVMTLQVAVPPDGVPLTAAAIACTDPRLAALVAKGLWVELAGLSTDPVTITTCKGN